MVSTPCNSFSSSMQRLILSALAVALGTASRLLLLSCFCGPTSVHVQSFELSRPMPMVYPARGAATKVTTWTTNWRAATDSRRHSICSKDILKSQSSSRLGSTAAASSADSSFASTWMENEKRIEAEMEQNADYNNDESKQRLIEDDNDVDTDVSALSIGRWEYIDGNYILRPPSSSENGNAQQQQQQQPRALLHFLGGALLGAAPQLTYRYMLERLARRGYLIVATPYQLSFDHLRTCDEIIDKFERVAPSLAKQYGPVPVVGVGHSCGALLHMLITSLFPDTPRAANALISYNNRGVSEAVPLFEEVVVPLFSDRDRNGSELMKSLIKVAREKYNGKVPSDESLFQLLQSIPVPIPGVESLLSPSLVSIPPPLRQTLTNFLAEPAFDALTNAGVTPLLLSSLDITQQIPKLIDEVEAGARDFVPTPDAMSCAARRAYRCRRTLLLQFDNDNLDDSEQLEGYLKEAESVMKMKRPMITIDLKRKLLDGNHLTPLLGPTGGEEWGIALETALGGILGGGASTNDGKEKEEVPGDKGNVVRERLGYEQLERVVEELVAWLDEGSL
ncbi:hypothetical protein HJC23_009451 [Cyclotella cryptica]|uniref:Uncharacterized protein n=1 Tax=Cyclotella cryptica TaxID=29204 RepID=A0ABD3Q165_9STRA